MKKTTLFCWIVALVTLLLPLGFAATAYAHGVVITYILNANGEVELLAEFDTGEVMAEAQVTIYSPEDPLTPWLTGVADSEGRYTFVIDPDMPGTWDIQYRKAGHGDFIHVQLEAGMIDPALMAQSPGELLSNPSTATVAIPVTESAPESNLLAGSNTGATGGFTSFQILLMSASVIWGFVGTALYFSSKKTQDHSHAPGHHH